MINRFALIIIVVSLAAILSCQVPQAVALGEATTQEQAAYEHEMKLAKDFMTTGDCARALDSLKRVVTMPHIREYYEDGPILSALGKCPSEPAGHIALALYYMKTLDQRYNDEVNERSWTPQADYELMVAIELSLEHKNAEAERYLRRLSDLKAKAFAVPDKWNHFRWRNFYIEILTQRWKPPPDSRHLIVRLDVDPQNKKVFTVVPSMSPEFDQSATTALTECVEEYRFLDWGAHNVNFAFMANGSSKIVEENTRSIEKNISLDTDAQKIAAGFLEKHLRLDAISHCFRDDEEGVYAIGRAPVRENERVCGTMQLKSDNHTLFWSCAILDGQPVEYRIWALSKSGSRCEIDLSTTELLTTDEKLYDCIDLQRVRNQLFSCVVNWQIANNQKQSEDQWLPRQPDTKDLQEHFVRNNDGKVVGYVCKLKDGRPAHADLDKDLLITKISVNGHSDEFWQKAYEERSMSAAGVRRAVWD